MSLFEFDWIQKWAKYSPDKIAIVDGDSGDSLTYRQLLHLSCVGANELARRFSLKKGDRVAVVSQNELSYFILFYSLQRIGAIMVPINNRLSAREIRHIVDDCQPALVLSHSAHQLLVTEALDTDAQKRQKAVHTRYHLQLDGAMSFSEAIGLDDLGNMSFLKESYFDSAELKADDAAMILYTSGTTGSPKGAVITYGGLFWNSINTSLRLNLSQHDCTVSFLPFFHTGGWNVLTTPLIHRGAQIILLKKFDADKILDLCERWKATILFGVPTTMDMLARSSSFNKIDLKTIRYAIVGGEPMPLELIRTWHRKGISIRQGYGLTEFGPNVFSLNEEDSIRKIGSIGFANFYIETKVIKGSGERAGVNEVGELLLKGPMAMKEYWNNPLATQTTLVEGWLHTGDLVRQDEDGYFYVVGRKKEMYISGGENVYPAEIEMVLRSNSEVLEVAVIGVADEKWGEVGKAYVVRKSSVLSEQALREYCLKNLAKFKIPKYFNFIESLPKGDSGKIQKNRLKDLSLKLSDVNPAQ